MGLWLLPLLQLDHPFFPMCRQVASLDTHAHVPLLWLLGTNVADGAAKFCIGVFMSWLQFCLKILQNQKNFSSSVSRKPSHVSQLTWSTLMQKRHNNLVFY